MEPTRIPHEESTIYSRYNFFAPSKKEVDAINKMFGCVKIITLEPNDVLFIPKGWWHYVECLDTSLSINIWIPMNEDCKDRLTETLVNLVSSTIGEGIPSLATQEVLSKTDCLAYVSILIVIYFLHCIEFLNFNIHKIYITTLINYLSIYNK